ncbi:MAG: hypothetical protein FJW36_23330 [Acidobacteria bacterium]|nr:hypothetical protein [Acidobacteriota bacterium]
MKLFASVGLGVLLAVGIASAQSSTILPKEIEWKPVRREQRWKIYRDKTFASSGAYFRALGAASGDQASDRPLSWPQGFEGYSRRVGQRFITFTMQDSLEAGLSAAAGFEPRYVRCKCTGAGRRFAHATKMNFLTYDAAGKQVVNWPKMVGAYGAGMVSTTWVRDDKWSAQGIQAGNTQLSCGIFLMSPVNLALNSSAALGENKKD